ncbi:UNVERIFIED_CONTAM: hypothetical protein FKN15_061918 [Acipenser sinensis]
MSEEEQDALSLAASWDAKSFLQMDTQDPDLTQVTAPSSGLALEPEIPAPSNSVRAMMERAANFLQISGFQGQALGRSLAGLVVACRQLWLSQARVTDADKSALLDTPISPGHTFGPAVEEIMQRCHGEREASRQVAVMLRSHASAQGRGRRWHLAVTTVTRTIPIPTAPRGDLRHCFQASAARSQQQARGNARRGAPAHHCPSHRNCPRQPPSQPPSQPQQPQQGP